MNRFYHALMLIPAGSAGLWLGARTLVKTLETGKARLRGGRTITRARNPGLFRTNVAALCTLILLMLCLLYIAATDLI